ncbi:MAG TPA: VOC family protein [Acidimicrobiales bacterium]|nr:VOC family protein [Acidimicrobiales bacterium]
MPLGHIGIFVDNLHRAKSYYDQLMPFLEYEPFLSAAEEFSYKPANDKRGAFIFFYSSAGLSPYSDRAGGLQHLAFMIPTRSRVRTVFARAVELGSEPVHGPREFPEYPPPYYAAFWRDPFGVMLEAVCHHAFE